MAKDLTKGNPSKLLIQFALPMAGATILQQLYNVADTVIVGRFVGETALAAVGSTGSISGLLLMLMSGATAGMSVVVSQFYGAGDTKTMKKTVATSGILVVLLALLLGGIGFFLANPLLRLTKVPENVLPEAALYLRIIMLGALATGLYNMAASLLRALGDSVTPLVILLISSTLNILGNLLLVVVIPLGVVGVALSTVLSSGISAVACMIYMWNKMPVLRFGREQLRLDGSIVAMVAKIGIPSALQSSTISMGMLMIQVIVNTYGSTVMAAYSVALKIESLLSFPGAAVGNAMTVYAGQNIGTGNIDRVKKGFRSAAVIVLTYDVCAALVMLLGGRWMLSLFTKDGAEVIRVGYQYLQLIALGLPFVGMLILSRSTLMGAGDSMIPFIMGLFEMVSRLACSLLLSIPFGYVGVFWGTPVAWLTACVFGLLRYFSGKWQTKRLVKN